MCCGRDNNRAGTGPAVPHKTGPIASAESIAASMSTRYMVVARQTSTDGKRFSTLTAAQDYARRSGGIIRQL